LIRKKNKEFFESGTGGKIPKVRLKILQPDIHMLMTPWYHQHMYVRLQVFHWYFELFGPSSGSEIFAEKKFSSTHKKIFRRNFESGTGIKKFKPPSEILQPDPHMLMIPWNHQHMYVWLQVFQ
jgi:hypothetical protein